MHMSMEEIRALDKICDPAKLLPTTIAFLKENLKEVNSGRIRRGLEPISWTTQDEARY